MSISGRFWRLAPEEWAKLESFRGLDPGEDLAEAESAFLDILFAEEWMDVEHHLDIDESWNLLAYLLQYGRDDPDGVMEQAILGGTDLPFEDSEEYVRFLTPDEVREVAEHLGRQSVDQLQSCLDLGDLRQAEIYPGFERWEPDPVRGLVERYFPTLVAFYQAAARADQHVVLARM